MLEVDFTDHRCHLSRVRELPRTSGQTGALMPRGGSEALGPLSSLPLPLSVLLFSMLCLVHGWEGQVPMDPPAPWRKVTACVFPTKHEFSYWTWFSGFSLHKTSFLFLFFEAFQTYVISPSDISLAWFCCKAKPETGTALGNGDRGSGKEGAHRLHAEQ